MPAGYHPPLFFKRGPYVRWDRLTQSFGLSSQFRPGDVEWARQYFPLRYSRQAVEQAAAHTLVLNTAGRRQREGGR